MTTPNAGTFELTQDNGDLLLYTTCAGAMARMGHDLTIKANQWTADVTVGDTPETSSVRVRVDMATLEVVGSTGGAKPISDSDLATIKGNLEKSVQPGRYPELTFTSTDVTGSFDAATVKGDLTLHGQTRPAMFAVQADGDSFTLAGVLTQSDFGIKPFSTMMGTLKLADEIKVEVKAHR